MPYQAVFLHLSFFKLCCIYFIAALPLLISITHCYATESVTHPISKKALQNKSAEEWIKEAEALSKQNKTASFLAAQQALNSALQSNNLTVLGQSNMLLGALSKQKKQYKQSQEYFHKAAEYFKRNNMIDQFVMAEVEYIRILIVTKQFELAEQYLEKLRLEVERYGQDDLIALFHVTKADLFYKKKNFKLAIEQYLASLKYQSVSKKSALKRRGQTYKMLAQSYKRLKDNQQTAHYYRKTLEDFTLLGEKKLIARTLNTLAEAERKIGHNMKALEFSIQSLAIHREINDPEGYAKALTGSGIIHRHIGNYEKSLELIHEAHQYYVQMGMVKDIAKTSNQMGLVYSRLEQYDLAKSFYELTIKLPEKKLDAKTLSSALRELAIIALSENDYSYAMENAYKALSIYEREHSFIKASTVARIIGNIYKEQRYNEEAINYYSKSLNYAKRANSMLSQIKVQIQLAAMLIETENDKAINLLLEAAQLATKSNQTTLRLQAYSELRKAEKVRENFAASLFYAEKEIVLTNALQKEKEEQELSHIKAKLHSYKMEMEVIALKESAKLAQLQLAQQNHEIKVAEQSKQISELKLSRNKYANFMLAALLILCLIAVGYIYHLFKKSRRENDKLDYLAARDPLTNCYNRRLLMKTLDNDFSELSGEQEYSLILVDIDHFKAVNDQYGHNIGDQVLCDVVQILQSSVRQTDMVARYGGEEFCILLPNTSIKKALQIASHIQHCINDSHIEDIKVTCSFGVTSTQFNAQSPNELIAQADIALYQSKENGRNRVTRYLPSIA